MWRHFYCIKMDVKKYSAGLIAQPEVHELNMSRVTDLLSEMSQGHYRRTSFHLAASQLATITAQIQQNEEHPYPPATFFLAHVKHELIYFEPNTMSVRVWTPQQDISSLEVPNGSGGRTGIIDMQVLSHNAKQINHARGTSADSTPASSKLSSGRVVTISF